MPSLPLLQFVKSVFEGFDTFDSGRVNVTAGAPATQTKTSEMLRSTADATFPAEPVAHARKQHECASCLLATVGKLRPAVVAIRNSLCNRAPLPR